MLPQLATQGEGKPEVSGSEDDAKRVFMALSFGSEESLWAKADLREVCHFLRGNVNLKCPDSWRQCFPSEL